MEKKCAYCHKPIIGQYVTYWKFDVHPECYDKFKESMTGNKQNEKRS